jgi:hypothetical protein
MTRKDFELIAKALRDARPIRPANSGHVGVDGAHTGIDNTAHELARALQATNPRFDMARFIAACGVKS